MIAGLRLSDRRRHKGERLHDSLESGIGIVDVRLAVGIDFRHIGGGKALCRRIDRHRFKGEHVADVALLQRIQLVEIIASIYGILHGNSVERQISDIDRALVLYGHDRRKSAIAGENLYRSIESADGRLWKLIGNDEGHAGRSALCLPISRIIDRKTELLVFELRKRR